MRFRIATYNIHKCRGVDGRTSADRIAVVLDEINADIVALQEVLHHEDLSKRSGFHYALGEARKHRGAAYGNLTLSRWDFKLVRPVDVTISGCERRVALRTDVRVGSHVLHLFNVHLGTALHERRKQAVRLMDQDLLRAVDINGPRVVMGDFNEWIHGL